MNIKWIHFWMIVEKAINLRDKGQRLTFTLLDSAFPKILQKWPFKAYSKHYIPNDRTLESIVFFGNIYLHRGQFIFIVKREKASVDIKPCKWQGNYRWILCMLFWLSKSRNSIIVLIRSNELNMQKMYVEHFVKFSFKHDLKLTEWFLPCSIVKKLQKNNLIEENIVPWLMSSHQIEVNFFNKS